MLRTKQIGTISQCARSFIFSGTRCGAVDGSSCTCPEDESCASRRRQTTNGVLRQQKPPTLVPKTSAKVGSLFSGDLTKAGYTHKADKFDRPTSLPQPLGPGLLSASDSGNAGVERVHRDMGHSPPVIPNQLVKEGIAAATFLTDLADYKIPFSDGGGLLTSAQHYIVDQTRPVSNVKSSNVKPIRRESSSKVQGKQTPEMARDSRPSTSSNHCATKAKIENPDKLRNFEHVSHAQARDTVVSNNVSSYYQRDTVSANNVSSNNHEKKRYIPVQQKARAQSHHAISNNASDDIWTPDTKAVDVGVSTGRHNKPSRDAKLATSFSSMPHKFAGAGHVVENVSHILHGLNWGPAAEQALWNLNCSVDPFQANQILKRLQDHYVALGFFYWLKGQPGFRHDGHTFTTMVGILGRAKEFGSINKLLDEMVQEGCQPNVVTYNRLIHSYGRANYLSEAMNVFYQMQGAGVEPDRVTYSTLIDIHAKAGFLDVAMYMYQRMQVAGLSPDTFTYSVMINCLGKAGHLVAAYKLFCEMVDHGCVPNIVTYNIMIALHAKARNYLTALKLYRDMQNAGFEPDKVTYSIVMEVLGHCGHLEEAEAIFAEMKRKNWVPDEPVYGLLVDLWGKAGNVEKARQWYQTMLNAGVCPNVPTCNSLLSAFLRMHRLSDAYHLLHDMLNLGLNPSLQTYTLLLSCCTEAQNSYEMGFCHELMSVTGHPAHSFLLSMPAAGPDGQNVRDHVSTFLDLMHSEDRESKRGLVDAVVDFLHKSGLKEEAGSVWEVAAQKNVYPDAVREKSSSYWLINLHVMSDGTAVTALSRTLAWFRRQLLLSGVCPSRIDIVTGWGRRSRVTGSSMVRQAVQELLNIFGFPFYTENGNSGCFVGCGEPLNRWLLQSYVERMHLL
ncbi:Pentatricopeptide repeat [Dillenia turbinata]|uniref:Pentatricopeptide repeat n=1 Tax=Dillenia turbinata TaxID=194707 RepID=A0AAN8YZF0_9MAGN